VISHFNQEYVKTKIFTSSTSSTIREASMLREKSDYEDFFEPNKEETIEIIKAVELFIIEVENYLKIKSII